MFTPQMSGTHGQEATRTRTSSWAGGESQTSRMSITSGGTRPQVVVQLMNISIGWPESGRDVILHPRTEDDLPAQVKGSAWWIGSEREGRSAYHIKDENHNEWPVEFLNNDWHLMKWEGDHYITRQGWIIDRGFMGLGYWDISDPRHPNYQAPDLGAMTTELHSPCKPPSIGSDTSSELLPSAPRP
jgi:hypothetical protein